MGDRHRAAAEQQKRAFESQAAELDASRREAAAATQRIALLERSLEETQAQLLGKVEAKSLECTALQRQLAEAQAMETSLHGHIAELMAAIAARDGHIREREESLAQHRAVVAGLQTALQTAAGRCVSWCIAAVATLSSVAARAYAAAARCV